MLTAEVLSLLRCPSCRHESLSHEVFEEGPGGEIREGVAFCSACRAWFPAEDGLLDLLVGPLAYDEDRARFRARYAAPMARLELSASAGVKDGGSELQAKQQAHFDWYSANEQQSYLEYEHLPFWVAVDALTFAEWRPKIRAGGWLLDVGCGNGRGTFKVMDLDLGIIAFDVAKAAVRQGLKRYRERPWAARAAFLAADASSFPVRSASMDHVLVYGVLHHVPDPRIACREVARVMKPGGLYLGSENNTTAFRSLFELLQRVNPLWYEEAGPEALISAASVRDGFAATDVDVRTRSFVFVPPHLANLLPARAAERLLAWTDRFAAAVPWLRDNGGLILIEGRKR